MTGYRFPGSFYEDRYVPTYEQAKRPHVIIFLFNNGRTAITQVFRTYIEAQNSLYKASVEAEADYGWHIKETAIVPLSELQYAYPMFRGKSESEAVKMLKGYAGHRPKKKKEPAPFGL